MLEKTDEVTPKNSKLIEMEREILKMAYWMRKPAKGLVHHSDRGGQYACHEYQNCLSAFGMISIMSRKGACWDNSPTERFFRSLKSKRLSDHQRGCPRAGD